MSLDEKHYRARITSRAEIAPDLWSFRIDPGAEFRFTPGQYATLGVDKATRRVERAYSIASSPYEKELEFFIELVPNGQTTPPLYDLKPGDEVLMRKVAKGHFTLDTARTDRTNHLMVSTVTGIAPFVSYVRTLYRDWQEGRFPGEHKLYLVGGASRQPEFGYREELENIATKAPWFQCAFTVSRPQEDVTWKGEVGRADDVLRKYADQWGCSAANTIAYLCGHPVMIENSKAILRRIGFQKEQLKEEVYWFPARAAAGA